MPRYRVRLDIRGYANVWLEAEDDDDANTYADSSAADLIEWDEWEPVSIEVEEVERDD